MINNLIEVALDLLYPKSCGFCEHVCSSFICEYCFQYIENKQKNIIKKYEDKNFSYHFWIFEYKDEIRERIIDYKFNEKSYLYRTFVDLILKNKKAIDFINKYDVLIPVPIHKKRLKKRGYNQSELICKGITKSINNIKLENKIITKKINIVPQSTLDKNERCANILNAYAVKNVDLDLYKGKKALIFDDVYTTGSTVNECARILKMLEFEEISVMTIARD